MAAGPGFGVQSKGAPPQHYNLLPSEAACTAVKDAPFASEVKLINYYSQDFEWEDLRREIEDTCQNCPTAVCLAEPNLLPPSNGSLESETLDSCPKESGCEKGHGRAQGESEGRAWEAFHTKHVTARFFKERRYLLEEFPELKSGPWKILEVGCGSGSTVVPLLTLNPETLVHACDCSPAAVAHTFGAAQKALGTLEASRRLKCFVWDAAVQPLPLGSMNGNCSQKGNGAVVEERTERFVGGKRRGVEKEASDDISIGSRGQAGWKEGAQDMGEKENAERGGNEARGHCISCVQAESQLQKQEASGASSQGGMQACMGQEPHLSEGSVQSECIVDSESSEAASRQETLVHSGNKIGQNLEQEGASGIAPGVCDFIAPLKEAGYDFVTLIFTLSAVAPEQMCPLLSKLHKQLRPGGLILFRDYGLYDMTMLRFPASQQVGDRLYRRMDGTLSYFFSKEVLFQLASQAGFSVVDCKYCCVNLRNKRKGVLMRRVWLHARLRRVG